MNLISIIIPTYNKEKYVKETIESVFSQSYKNLEIVVVDDGSTDNTRQILEPYIKEKKIKYIYQENQGQAEARNNGFRNSNGEFILFLDSDDILHPDAIRESLKFLEESKKYGLVYFDFLYFFNDDLKNKFRHRFAKTVSGDVFEQLLKEGPCCNPSQALIRREIAEKNSFDPKLSASDDWDYWLAIAYQGIKFGFIPKVLVWRRISDASDSYGIRGRIKCKDTSIKLYEKWMNILPERKEEIMRLARRLKTKRTLLYLMKTPIIKYPLLFFDRLRNNYNFQPAGEFQK